MTPLPRLNIVGTGKLGAALGALLATRNLVCLGDLYNRTLDKARQAVSFCGQGRAVNDIDSLRAADIWLIAVPDDQIQALAERLSLLALPWNHCTVFHCSGLHSAETLSTLKARGAHTASLHPAHSFASPARSLETFSGTCCALEGDETAVATLTGLFSALDARLIPLPSGSKPLYHAATVMASNYLVTLMDASLRILEKAGIDEADGRALLMPLAARTVANIEDLGTKNALTGPIARGDNHTVLWHIDALKSSAPEYLQTYCCLGQLTLSLSQKAFPDNEQGHRAIADSLARQEKKGQRPDN